MNQEKITNEMYFYASVIIVPLGLILNGIKFYTFGSSKFKKINMGFLMRSLGLFESVALFWNIVIYKYLSLNDINIIPASSISCILIGYLARVFQIIPLLIQAFISLVNYLSVTNPAKMIYLSKKSHLIMSILIISLFCFLINIPSAIRYVESTTFNNKTIQVCSASPSMTILSTLISAFTRCILPFLLINIINIFTVKALIRPRSMLNIPTENEKKFAKTLICLGLIFFLFNFPLSCVQIVVIIYEFTYDYSLDSSTMINLNLILDITRIIGWSYYGIGFFVNLTFNKVFRNVLINNIKNKICF